ncbi:hypothetical protein CDAR_119461 [Caerostris darwini]|uniref:Uncharacterized protein n=1 Tax=Caerostris darwini TaxID=1538125 RepID=A0AAV4QPH8_9ARAC|nr:hypothetical protein CDAR_119461 [Caerostris darwini]
MALSSPLEISPTVIKRLPEEDGLQISILAPDSVDRQARGAIHWLMSFVFSRIFLHLAQSIRHLLKKPTSNLGVDSGLRAS